MMSFRILLTCLSPIYIYIIINNTDNLLHTTIGGDVCVCHNDDKNGHWTGTSCEDCMLGWKMPTCTLCDVGMQQPLC